MDSIQPLAHMCEYEADRHRWRAEILGFIRDNINACETYRLTAVDLEFAEVLPEKPPVPLTLRSD